MDKNIMFYVKGLVFNEKNRNRQRYFKTKTHRRKP